MYIEGPNQFFTDSDGGFINVSNNSNMDKLGLLTFRSSLTPSTQTDAASMATPVTSLAAKSLPKSKTIMACTWWAILMIDDFGSGMWMDSKDGTVAFWF
jgi:hypothetical protein